MNNPVTTSEIPTDVVIFNRSVSSSSLLSSSDSSSTGVTVVLQVVACALLSCLAVTANVAVIVAVVRSRTQRRQLTNFFVVNLCLVDIVAAAVVIPLSTVSGCVNSALASAPASATATTSTSAATAYNGGGANSTEACAVDVAVSVASPFGWYPLLRIATTFVAFASVLSAAAVSVERCFSIRYPMLHAAHLTVGRTMGIIGYIWIQAGLLAAVPHVTGWSVLAYRGLVATTGNWIALPVRSCSSGWPIAFIVAAVFVFFIVPSAIMAIAYCVVYRVARRTARQICPTTFTRTTSSTGRDCSRGMTEIGDRTPSDGRLRLDCSDVPTVIIPLSSCTFSSSPSPSLSPAAAAATVPPSPPAVTSSALSTTDLSDNRTDNGASNAIAVRETSAGELSGCDGTMAVSLNGVCCPDQQHQQPASDAVRSSFHCCCGGDATVTSACCGLSGSDQPQHGTPKMPDVCIVTIHTECCNDGGRETDPVISAATAAAAAAATVSNSLPSLPEVTHVAAGGSQSNLLNVPQPSTNNNNNNNNSGSSNNVTSPLHSPSPTMTIGSKITVAGSIGGSVNGGGGSGDVTGRKAAITLMFVVLTFVPLWTPFFVVGVYRTIDDWSRCRQIRSTCSFYAASAASAAGVTTAAGLDRLEAVVVWCAFTTFAINPFVYGWMNRAIRDELRSTFDAIRWSVIVCWRRHVGAGSGRSHWPRSSLAGGPGYADELFPDGMWGADDACGGLPNDPEDFFQFLERTSASRSQSAVPPPVSALSGSQRTAGSTTQMVGQSKSTTKSLAQGANRPPDGSNGGRLRCFVIDAHESSSSCSIANSEPNSSLWG
jgi:hypothetical protein